MKNRLRDLLIKTEESSPAQPCTDDNFISLTEAIAIKIRANYGGDSVCSGNTQCSGNGTCTNNNQCTNNKLCKTPPPPPAPAV